MTKQPVAQPKTHLPAPAKPSGLQKMSVNRPGDRWEKEADRAAEAVMKGAQVKGSAGFSFSNIPVGQVQREDTKGKKAPAEKSDADKYKEGLTKAGEAALKTEAGKKLLEKIENDKLVKGGKQFFESTPGKIVAGAIAAGGVTGLIVAKQPLPFKLPDIPINDNMKIGIDIQGPLNCPTSGMLTFTYSASGGKSKDKSKEDFARETAELRRSLEMFQQKPKYVPPAGLRPLAPYRDQFEPKKEEEKKKKHNDKGVVQRKEATTTPGVDVPQSVPDSLNGPGQPLERSTRQTMEAQFGYDFSQVRIHTDRQASDSARAINSVAYTVGRDIVFAGGRYSPASPNGKRLLAHELTHVVQQGAAPTSTPVIQRGFFEWVDDVFGGTNFSEDQLLKYLEGLKKGKIAGGLDGDNKARAVVKKMKAGDQKFKPDEKQTVTLIKEMQSGFTGDDDEQAILFLLNRAKNTQLSTMLNNGLNLVSLDSDIDGAESDQYHLFLDKRFDGGSAAVLAGKIKLKPWVETFGKMQAEVTSVAEIAEVKRIKKEVEEKYDIDLDSDVGIEGIKKRYTKVPQSQINGLKKRVWHLDEMRALERALAHYAPILGPERAKSTRAKAGQEITTASKVEQSIDKNTPKGVLDTTTMGEYFGAQKNFSLFKAAEGYSGDFPGDVPKELESTIAHELSHGLLKYELPHFVKTFKYWKSTYVADANSKTRVANKKVEAPITFYGGTSADEDLAESANFYFVAPETLKKGNGKPKGTPGNPAPKRFDFVDTAVKNWKPKPKKKPAGKKKKKP